MQPINCMPENFLPILDTDMRNALYVKSEVLSQKYDISVVGVTNGLINLSNNQTVTYEDLLTLPDKDLILNNPQVPLFSREPFISSGEDMYYSDRKDGILGMLRGLGLNLNEDEVYEDLPFKYITDMLNIPDDVERNRKLGINNAIINEEDISLGDYYDIVQEFKDVPDLGIGIDGVKTFSDYYYLNSYIPNKNFKYLLKNIKSVANEYYERIKQSLSSRSLDILLVNLKRMTNIEYKYVNTDKFKARIRYGVVEIGSNVSKEDLFHEYLHPFLLALQVENPELYANLVQQKEVQDLANYLRNTEVYKDYAEEESLVRILARKYESNVFKEFYNWLAMIVKKILGLENTVNLKTLSSNTSMQDIVNIMTSSNIIDINSDYYKLQERYNINIKHTTEQLQVVERINQFEDYILVYKVTDETDPNNIKVDYSFVEDGNAENQDSFYILQTDKNKVEKLIEDGDYDKIADYAYERATNYIDAQSGVVPEPFSPLLKKVGKSSSDVGTLYHKLIEMFNDYIKQEKLEGKFTGDTDEENKVWEEIKSVLLRKYITYGSTKIYVSPFSHTVDNSSEKRSDVTEYDFEGYDDEKIKKLDEMFTLLDLNNKSSNKSEDVLDMLLKNTDISNEYAAFLINCSVNGVIDEDLYEQYIEDIELQIEGTKNIQTKINREKELAIAPIFYLLTTKAAIDTEAIITNIFQTYATYLSPVTVNRDVIYYYKPEYNYKYTYDTIASVNSVDNINAYKIGENSDFFKELEKFIKSHDRLPYYDTKNYFMYADVVLDSFREIYANIYNHYTKNCIVINEKTVGYDENGVKVVGTIDSIVVGQDANGKVNVGILDYKTVGRTLFNTLTDTAQYSKRKLIAGTIKKYGHKQYLYQELLSQLLAVDISEITNALYLIKLDRKFEYETVDILEYLKRDEIEEREPVHKRPTYKKLLSEIAKIDVTILKNHKKHRLLVSIKDIGELIRYLGGAKKISLDPTNKKHNRLIATLAALNQTILARRYEAIKQEMYNPDYNMLSKNDRRNEATKVVDMDMAIVPTKSVISKPETDTMQFIPIYFDKDKVVGKFNEEYLRRYETYRSLINYYLNDIHILLQNQLYQEDEYKYLKKMLENSVKKLTEYKTILDGKRGELNVNTLEVILDLAFSTTNHAAIMKLLHNVGDYGTTFNSELNKQQVFSTQTYKLHMEINTMVDNTRISATNISRELNLLDQEQKNLQKQINLLKTTSTVTSIKNSVIEYDNEELNVLNNKFGSNVYKRKQLESKLQGYTKSINDLNEMSSLLLVLYTSALKDFNLEKLHVELSYMKDMLIRYIDDVNKEIDVDNMEEDLSIKVAKFSAIEKIISVYGSFSSMLNTNVDTVEINGIQVPVKDIIKKLDYNLFEDLKEINPDLFNKINSLTNDFKVTLRLAANEAAKNHIANVINVYTSGNIVAQSSLKDLDITAEKVSESLRELAKDFAVNRKFIPDLLRGYHDSLLRMDAIDDRVIIEQMLNDLDDNSTITDFGDIYKLLSNVKDSYYKNKVTNYLANRKNANAEEFIRLAKELDKNSIPYTDAIFKKLNESFLGASKSSYRVVQLLAIINTEIEENYVSLYSKMIKELELNTSKAKLDDSTEGMLKALSNKRFILKEGLLDFNPFIATTTDTLITLDYLTDNYLDVFDEDDLEKVKGYLRPDIEKYITANKLVDKYKILKTNTLITRGKWNLFEKFINIRGGLTVLNNKETPQSMANSFVKKETFSGNHNKVKRPVIKEFMEKIDETYYHFDYRYYYLKEYLADLEKYYDEEDVYRITFINDLKVRLGIDPNNITYDINSINTTAIQNKLRDEEIAKLNDHYSNELLIDDSFVIDILLDIEKKYDNYKNKLCGVERNQQSLATLTKSNNLKMYCETNNIRYNVIGDDIVPIAMTNEQKARFQAVLDKANAEYDKQVLNFYKSYSPFSYSEQRSLYDDTYDVITQDNLFISIFKAKEFYKVSNYNGVNVVYLPKVTNSKENLDERFDQLLDNEDHYKYYKYLKYVVTKLHDYIPYNKRNSNNPLDLPAINESIWDLVAKIHNIKDIKNISYEDLMQLAKENITSFIPPNYEEPYMNVNTLKNSGLGDYKEYRQSLKNLSTQLDKTIQLFMFEALVHKARIQLLPLNKMVLNLTKDTENTMLKDSANYAYIQNITSSSIRDVNSKPKRNPTLTEKDRKEIDDYTVVIEDIEKEMVDVVNRLEQIQKDKNWKLDPDIVVSYYELKGVLGNLKRRKANYLSKINTVYDRSYIDSASIERNINSLVKLTGLSYNLTGQVNNLLMGFIQTKNRAMGNDEENKAYEKAFGIMNNIMKPEMLMTLAGITANQLTSMLVPIPVVGQFAAFVSQMLVMSKIGTSIEKRTAAANNTAQQLFGNEKDMLKNFVLTPDLVKFINMNINYNFTNDITEEGKTGKTRRRLTVDQQNQSLDTKNQLVNLLKPYTYIQRAELFVAMYSMIIQAELEKVTINGVEMSFADIHNADGDILDEYKPYVSDLAINQFRRKTLSRMFEASGNYREIPQIEKYPMGKSALLYLKWVFEPLYHMFHRTTDKSDNVFLGQSEATTGTVNSMINQVHKSYLKVLKNSVLMNKTLSDKLLIESGNIDLTFQDAGDPNKVVNFINRYATNLHSNFNRRIVLYKRGDIITDHILIKEFIEERRLAILNPGNADPADLKTALEFILNKKKYEDIRLLAQPTTEEKNSTILKILGLAGELLLPTNHIPAKYSFLRNKNIGDILKKYVNKDMQAMNDYERANHKALREFISGIHAWISWSYFKVIETVIAGAIIGLFDLDKDDEVYQIIQSFDNKFNKLYQDVAFLNTPNPFTKLVYVPYRIKESLFSPLTFYNNRVVPLVYDVGALPLYTASELITSDDSQAEDVFEDIYKAGGFKHPYLDSSKGQFSNWRIINDVSRTVPVVNRLSAWEKDEMLEQQSY